MPWSLILKIALPPPVGAGLPDGSALPDTANWQREFRIYESGLLPSLPPGLTAPRCHGTEDRAAQGLWLWLEDLGALDESPWSAARVRHLARRLGAFGGAFPGAQAVPHAPWLCARWLRKWVGSPAMVPDRAVGGWLSHPDAARLLPTEHVARFTQLWQEREQFLTALDHVPLTFCHNDVNRANVFVRSTASGDDEIVVIDWEDAGPGAVGEDLAILVTSRLHHETTTPAKRARSTLWPSPRMWRGCARQAGRTIPASARFAYATRTALVEAAVTRYFVQGLAAGRLSPTSWRAFTPVLWRRPSRATPRSWPLSLISLMRRAVFCRCSDAPGSSNGSPMTGERGETSGSTWRETDPARASGRATPVACGCFLRARRWR